MVREKLILIGEGLYPLPKQELIIDPPTNLSRQTIKNEVLRISGEYIIFIHNFKNHSNKKGGHWQWKDPFKKWQDTKKISPIVRQYLNDQFMNMVGFDASRGVDQICALGYKGFNNTLWMTDLALTQYTNLGDGVVIFDKKTRTFDTSQQKGNYPFTTHLFIRKRK